MTTSAIRFRSAATPASDPELRELLKALAEHLPDYAADHPATFDWLAEACLRWMDDHEASAPGLRDLELDEALTTPERLTGLIDYLTWLTAPARGPLAQPTARIVIERVLVVLRGG